MAFGGRGRGRGRPIPVARHDIQLPEDEQMSDVPLTFPKPPLGQMPSPAKHVDLTAEQQRLLIRFTKMRNAYRSSPFFLETVKSGQVDRVKGSQPDVGQYEDEVRTAAAETRRPLHEVITMHEKYMPKELFSDKEQKKSLRARKLKTKAAKQEGEVDFAQLQPDADVEKEDADEDGEEKEKGEEAPEEEDDDDEFDHEDDDYYQGEHFDDDEEYDDGDDGDGEAYF